MKPKKALVKLLKSKKGAIPVINEVVDIILNITPKPILLLIFLLLITTIASFVMPFLLGVFGYSCVNEGGTYELYKVPVENIVQKTLIIDAEGVADTLLGLDDLKLPEDPFKNGDKRYVKIPDPCIIKIDVQVNKTLFGYDTYPLVGYVAFGTNCTLIKDDGRITNTNIYRTWTDSVCVSDGYALDLDDLGLWVFYRLNANARKFNALCQPPNPYYYNHTIFSYYMNTTSVGYFTIMDESLLPNIEDDYLNNDYVEKIKKIGGIKQDQDNSQFVNIQCEYETPQLYFFSVKVFDRNLWIWLLIASFLIPFAFDWYSLFM